MNNFNAILFFIILILILFTFSLILKEKDRIIISNLLLKDYILLKDV